MTASYVWKNMIFVKKHIPILLALRWISIVIEVLNKIVINNKY